MARTNSQRGKILKVARDIVLRKGFGGTSIDEIIAAAEITKGGFFYHFRGKSDLARAMMRDYIEADERFFAGLIARAQSLVDDPLQQLLAFLKLFAEAMADLPSVHPGCLVATFTYEAQLFDPEIHELTASGVLRWREIFVHLFQRVLAEYEPKEEVDLEGLADSLTSIMEGGILLSRTLNDPQVLVEQVMHFRRYVRLLFADN